MQNPKLSEILEKVKAKLQDFYQDQLESIVLYGSQARGDAKGDSDIDLLVILKKAVNPFQEIDRTGDFIADLCLDYDVVISRHFISSDKFQKQNSPFLSNVKREGILL
jgi:predicted nucleotidyltransferase